MTTLTPYTGSIELITGPMFSEKCLGKGTKILMYDGSSKNVEDVVNGNILMGDDSSPRLVSNICRGRGKLFSVQPKEHSYGRSGTKSYIVNENHILSLMLSTTLRCLSCDKLTKRWRVNYIQNHIIKSKSFYWSHYDSIFNAKTAAENFLDSDDFNQKGDIIDISVSKYFKQSKEWKRYYKGFQVGIEFKEKDILIDPYLLGLWLGDGTKGKTQITNVDEEIIDFIKKYSKNNDYKLSIYGGITYDLTRPHVRNGCRGGSNPLRTDLQCYGIFKTKRIPKEYLLNSRNIRLHVLAGLLDSDGSFEKCYYSITQKSKELAEDIIYLVRSLGYRASIKEYRAKCSNGTNPLKEYLNYRIHIGGSLSFYDIPIKVKRKKAPKMKKAYNRNWEKAGILTTIEIKHIDEGEYYGFSLDGNHRFLLADFTVTHNSSTLINRVERYLIAKRKVIALKWKGDTRYTKNPEIMTHSGLTCSCIPCDDDDLKTVYPKLKDFEIICIDEGCFFKNIVAFCDELANKGHTVIVASLIGTYFRDGFNDILNLIPKCEKVTMLKAICMRCYKDGATFTELVKHGAQRDGKELIGGTGDYIAVCRRCYFESS